jgi:quercetin dioxygenase-like cupin family protein
MSERIKGKTLVARDEGDDVYGVVIKVYGPETNGAVGITEQSFEPGFLLPPHVHENDVWLYILEGEMHVRVSDEVVKATPGCWVLKPRRIPHTMWNAGPEAARIIEVYTPGGFELFFKDFGERLRQGPIGLEELNRLGEPHGIRRLDSRAQSGLQPAPHRRRGELFLGSGSAVAQRVTRAAAAPGTAWTRSREKRIIIEVRNHGRTNSR